MKNLSLIALSALLVINLIVGFCSKDYETYNTIWSSVVIVVNMAIMYLAFSCKLNAGFYYSLAVLLPLFCIIEIISALCLEKDSALLLAFLLITILVEALMVYIVNVISKKNY